MKKEQLLIRVIPMHADCKQKHIFSRMIFAQLCREEGATVVRIAKEMKRNHATIIYYLRKYPDDYRYTPEFRAYANAVKAHLSKD